MAGYVGRWGWETSKVNRVDRSTQLGSRNMSVLRKHEDMIMRPHSAFDGVVEQELRVYVMK